MAALLRVGHQVSRTTCEGPGERFAVWVSGCSLRCPGCCNPELFDAQSGEAAELATLVSDIEAEHRTKRLDGVTFLGGEPLEQASALGELCDRLRRRLPELGIIVFSGWEAERVLESDELRALRRCVDTFVAGPFIASQPEPVVGGRRFIGSHNQVLVHQSDRYNDTRLWQGPRRAELHVDAEGRISVHGEPELTRRLRRRLTTVRGAATS